jgi:hypothetical protein
MPTTVADRARRDRRSTRLVIGAAVVIALVVVAVVVVNLVPRSRTDGPDQTYLGTVQPLFPAVSTSALVKLGHTVCTTFDRNSSDPVAAEYQIATAALAHKDLPSASMVSLIKAAVRSYCPQWAYVFTQNQQTTTST